MRALGLKKSDQKQSLPIVPCGLGALVATFFISEWDGKIRTIGSVCKLGINGINFHGGNGM